MPELLLAATVAVLPFRDSVRTARDVVSACRLFAPSRNRGPAMGISCSVARGRRMQPRATHAAGELRATARDKPAGGSERDLLYRPNRAASGACCPATFRSREILASIFSLQTTVRGPEPTLFSVQTGLIHFRCKMVSVAS
jgi:hypothetical protein